MAMPETIARVRSSLAITHTDRDNDIDVWIEACLADLTSCGVSDIDEKSPLVLSAIIFYCKAQLLEAELQVSEAFKARYDELKGHLMIAGDMI